MINFLIKICICILTFICFFDTESSEFENLQQGSKKVAFVNLKLSSVKIDKSNLRNFEVTFPGYMGLKSKVDIYVGCLLIAAFEPLAFEEDYGYVLISEQSSEVDSGNLEIGRINLRGYKENEILKWKMFFDIRNPLNRSFVSNSSETVLYQRDVTLSFVPTTAIIIQTQNPPDVCIGDSDVEYLKDFENCLYGFTSRNMGQPNENSGILFRPRNISEDSPKSENNGCCTIQ